MARLDLDAIRAAAPTMTADEKQRWSERIRDSMAADLAEMRDLTRSLHAWMLLTPEELATEMRTPVGPAGLALLYRARRTLEHVLAREEGRIPDDEVTAEGRDDGPD
jgi:hypothetical protein